VTYETPQVPSLFTALTSGEAAASVATYGRTSNPFVLEHNQVVELILNNRHMINHPFHLHGHQFQAVWRSEPGGGDFPVGTLTEDDFNQNPVRRDTLVLPNGGSMVIRFRADNPGMYSLHTVKDWHAPALFSSEEGRFVNLSRARPL
jgi:iron transport multicopper oxidase